MGASACLTLAIVHLVIWCKQTDQLAHLLFSVTAISVAAIAAAELLAMLASITRRRQAEVEAARQRCELAHLSRVTLLGELSGSLAHELNQPLGAIVTNAGAALRFLARDTISREKFREILEASWRSAGGRAK
jgi:C4-dicarboxylate-specific signal transduction histidine kinase